MANFNKKLNGATEEIHVLRSRERQLEAKSIFFKKYCFKAEEKLNKFTKLTRRNKEWNDKVSHLADDNKNFSQEVENLRFTIKKQETEMYGMKKEIKRLNEFYENINPVLKITWDGLKSEANDVNEVIYDDAKKNERHYVESIETLINFWKEVKNKIKSTKLKNNSFEVLLVELKDYLVNLIKKNGQLAFNQYHIINSCCFLNEKVQVMS